MRRLRVFLARVSGLGRARSLDDDLRREIAGHLDEATEDFVRQGLSPAEARRAAMRRFGGVAQTEDAYREARSFVALQHLERDLRHAARALRRSPGFSIVVLGVLAIGTAAVTSVFTLLNAIVLRPLPFADADRLVVVNHAAPGLNRERVGLSDGLYFFYKDHAHSLEPLALYEDRSLLNLSQPGSPTERVHVTHASAEVFQVLGARPERGRLFTDADGQPGFKDLNWKIPALVSHEFWTGHLGADPHVVGRVLTINDNPREVVGVMPEGFAFPDSHTQIWILIEPARTGARFASGFGWSAIARLRPGVTPESAQADLASVLPQIEGAYKDATPQRIARVRLAPLVTPFKSAVIGDVAHVLWTLFGGMALVLAIAVANAASLFAVRAEQRRREIAVRQALGANQHHVARLFLTEALVLTTAAAALGLLLANGVLSGVIAWAPVELPRTGEIALGGETIAFAAGLAVLMAVFYSVLSVRHQRRSITVGLLGGSSQWATRQAGRRRTRDPFVVLQVALALALMVGSGLMVKTYRNLSRSELGFSPGHLLTAEVSLPYREAGRHARVYEGLADRIRHLAGVDQASLASFLPLTDPEYAFPVQVGAPPVPFKFFTPGYVQTMGTAIVDGVGLAAGEPIAVSKPVLISAALARRLFPGENAVGRTVQRLNKDGSVLDMASGPVPPFTIAGVVGDVREVALRRDPTEILYIPVIEPAVEESIVPTDMTVVVRTRAEPLAMAAAVRAAIAEFDPALSIGQVRTMDAIVSAARSREAFVGALLLLAAAVSLLLGAVGIYGSVAHVVRHRTREIGIRLALGARRADVTRMVVAGSMRAVIAGAALGLLVALVGTRMLSALLFQVQPRDPVILVAVTGILLVVAGAAAILAAGRAARVAPVLAMRCD